jgi:hypothetical protein
MFVSAGEIICLVALLASPRPESHTSSACLRVEPALGRNDLRLRRRCRAVAQHVRMDRQGHAGALAANPPQL